MQNQQDELLQDLSKYDAHPLIVRMQEFLDYATHMVAYSSLACDFIGLSKEMMNATDHMLEYATEMKERCHWSLTQESLENLLQKEKIILDEIETHAHSLAQYELSLDKYLIFADTHPEIRSAFLTKEGCPLFGAANC